MLIHRWNNWLCTQPLDFGVNLLKAFLSYCISVLCVVSNKTYGLVFSLENKVKLLWEEDSIFFLLVLSFYPSR